MVQLKPGIRLRSQVDATEVVVVRPPTTDVFVSCGGHPMIDAADEPATGLVAEAGEGTQLGKRYAPDDGSMELLVVKPGSADLAVDGVTLSVKAAKPLPASD
ncbi:hypothetical protein ACH4VM_33195 [Streptomyces sp. NPDC020792]|uniref:hypothetical protein n=1 Tax=Streptomyces sp. NPDC020792 TaxID=3365089 RepID=UPI0037B3E281